MKVDREELAAALKNIEDGLNEYIGGINNPTAQNDVMGRIEVLSRMFTDDPFIGEKIDYLREACRALYSQKGWREYGSAEETRSRMKYECRVIRMWGCRDRSETDEG